MPVEGRAVLRRIEGQYLLDYALFSGAAREYVTRTLQASFEGDGSDQHRRMYTLALYREEYMAYEDLGAFLSAILQHLADPERPILESLLSYGPGSVRLERLFKTSNITSPSDLSGRLGLLHLIPYGWSERFPEHDLEKVLRVTAEFFFTDCTRNQRERGVITFNKIKHALLVVPDARAYLPHHPIDGPAALFPNPGENKDEYPISVYAVRMDDEQLELRAKAIHFVQVNLRLIAGLIVMAKHPSVIAQLGSDDPFTLVRHRHWTDVMEFLRNISKPQEA